MNTRILLSAALIPLSFLLPALSAEPAYCNIRDFGAVGDGQTINTEAINRAIDEAVKHGGGTVFFPAGNYLSYSIHLQNNRIAISNLTMRDIVDCPIFVRLGGRMRAPPSTPMSTCRRISINNVVVYNAHYKCGCIISGLPGHNIEDVTLGNITIYYKGGGTKEMAKRQVEEYEKDYPEPQDFGTLPSYGFFFRHVKDLKVHDVETHFLSEEQRPPFVFDDVQDACFHHVIGQKAPGSPAFLFTNVKSVTVQQCPGAKDSFIRAARQKEL